MIVDAIKVNNMEEKLLKFLTIHFKMSHSRKGEVNSKTLENHLRIWW